MKLHRTAIAGLLMAGAVILPCTAWYVVGSRAADQQSREILHAHEQGAVHSAERLAARVQAVLGRPVDLDIVKAPLTRVAPPQPLAVAERGARLDNARAMSVAQLAAVRQARAHRLQARG